MQPGQQGRGFRPGHMGGDAQPEMPPFGVQRRQRSVVRGQELARPVDEYRALRGKPHQPRRALDQLVAQAGFQALEFDADRALGSAQRVGRFR
ncbi:hypothetical protein D3C72_2101730 [compost metagenome]